MVSVGHQNFRKKKVFAMMLIPLGDKSMPRILGAMLLAPVLCAGALAQSDGEMSMPDVEAAFDMAMERGAQAALKPETLAGERGEFQQAAIHTYGETLHSLVERNGIWPPPDFEVWEDEVALPVGFRQVDHVVGNVAFGEMDRWVEFYENVFGFVLLRHFDDEAISTEYTALMSKVLWDGNGRIKLPINEPAEGKKKSQIEEYLDFYRAPGVQHMALATDDIITTVRMMRENGVRFLTTPKTYYEDLRSRLDWSTIDADLDQLAELGILVDQDDEGYLLQIFTKSVQDRPTVFYEIIERHGSRGFGVGNFQALFEAIERDQAERGNL